MASSFKLTLDTTAPSLTAALNGGASVTSSQTVAVALKISDASRAGYQYKIWGNVDTAADANVQTTEEASSWVTYGEAEELTRTIKLATGDGAKAIHFKARDDVWNESAAIEKTVELNTKVPTMTITAGPTPTKISKISGKRTSAFTFKANEAISEWRTEVVSTSGDAEGTGTLIPTTNGSVTSGAEVASETGKEGSIDGRDLATASGADGEKTIKVFGKSKASGLWSV
jgi:hypothetical protein